MKSLVRSAAVLVAAAALGAGMALGGTAMAGNGHGNGRGEGHGGPPPTAQSIYTDKIADYGVCRGVDPSCYNDWGNGWEEGEQKRILIWSRTGGPRHAHLGTPLGPGLNPPLNDDNVAQANLKQWAEERGIAVDYTEDLSQFKRLDKYQAVVFLSSNRDTLDLAGETALMQYIRGGGGFVGIHNAFGTEYDWPYYEGLLGGANYYNHGHDRDGTLEVMNHEDVSTKFITGDTQAFHDEWYNLVPYPSFVNVLLEVDKATSEETVEGPGEHHAVSWCQYYDGGRAWLTTLGHDVADWSDDPMIDDDGQPIAGADDFFEEHVMAGIESVVGLEPFCRS